MKDEKNDVIIEIKMDIIVEFKSSQFTMEFAIHKRI